jgi:hypothetical protein
MPGSDTVSRGGRRAVISIDWVFPRERNVSSGVASSFDRHADRVVVFRSDDGDRETGGLTRNQTDTEAFLWQSDATAEPRALHSGRRGGEAIVIDRKKCRSLRFSMVARCPRRGHAVRRRFCLAPILTCERGASLESARRLRRYMPPYMGACTHSGRPLPKAGGSLDHTALGRDTGSLPMRIMTQSHS